MDPHKRSWECWQIVALEHVSWDRIDDIVECVGFDELLERVVDPARGDAATFWVHRK